MYHKVIVIGYAGRDPELRYTPDGQLVAALSVASSYGREGGKITLWWRISLWGRLAEIASSYVRSGSLVYVEGYLRPDPQTGGPRIYQRRDGAAGAAYELTADTLRLLSRPDSPAPVAASPAPAPAPAAAAEAAPPAQAAAPAPATPPPELDDLPF